MLALKVYRMLDRMDILDGYDKACSWEYKVARSFECSRFIDKEFFKQWEEYNAEWEELANAIYGDAKMRRIAEILDKDIAELFKEWDMMPDDLPFE